MNYKRAFILISFFRVINYCYGQPETEKIIPLSPNVATIIKYGDIPVGNFTGVPNIGIPLYTITLKKINLPIGLNYHAGGNKVEDIASWAGLGWSITTLPSISRRINGIADETAGGFFSKYYGHTAKKMKDSLVFGNANSWNYVTAIYDGTTDTEADIFSFNLINKSGKFYWNQETEKFHVTPWRNIKVEFTGGNFKITDDDGTIYFLGTKETSTVSGSSSNSNVSSWLVDWIKDADNTDNLVFEYESEYQLIKTINSKSKLLWGSDCGISQSAITINNNYSLTVKSILFASGKVYFNKSAIGRLDLNGAKALDNIEIRDLNQSLVKRFEFEYDYYSGLGNSEEHKRMLLLKLREKDKYGASSLVYDFSYETSIIPPSRLSFAQDYWGFYNGALSNEDLVPPAQFLTPNGIVSIPGADRTVRPEYTQIGILKKIIYPTGGYSEFEYENNQTHDSNLPAQYITNGATLGSDGNSPPSSFYSTTFLINNPPDNFINGGNGGANSIIQVGGVSCMGCSSFNLRGLDPTNSHINLSITFNQSYYLPNGNYEMSSNFFNQPPQDFENFYFIISWQEINNNVSNLNRNIGGLRIKKIKNFDGINQILLKTYKYTTSYLSDTSSGEIFGVPYFTGYEDYTCINYTGNGYHDKYSHRLSASSNYTQVSHSGSFIGYKKVFEQVESTNGSNGVTENSYTHARDVVMGVSPFPPAYSMESFRGQLQSQIFYKLSGSLLSPVASTHFEYRNVVFDEVASFNLKVKLIREPVYENTIMVEIPVFEYISYENIPHWSEVSKKVERVYSQHDPSKYIETITRYYYDNPIHYNLTRLEQNESKGQLIKTDYKYPHDFQAIPPYNEMVSRNIIGPVIETKQTNITLNKELSKTTTNYDFWFGGTLILPKTIQKSFLGSPLQTEITFNVYDSKGKILQTTDKSGIVTAYLWGYNSQYPVAKLTNTTYAVASTYITQSVLNAAIGNDDAAIRNHLNNLRNIPGAFVTTYTYKPLVGMTSETDPNGRTIYYEYDAFNRLSIVRDQHGKILKKICYNYAGQPENCCINTAPIWQNQGAPYCETSNGQNTGNQLQLQKDINPCSSTYNQTQTVLLGYNPSACSIPNSCNTSNCIGLGYKCVNNTCELGVKVYTYSYWDYYLQTNVCVYHWEWSDFTWSGDYYEYDCF